jgi:glycosyltransferase involved in cell wall biosynthesis
VSIIQFSAVIPTFNSSAVLERAIKSVLSQSLPPLELLVIDDGSTDDSQQIVRAYKDRVRYYRLPHTGFPAIVRNQGILRSHGTHIAFLDADDTWLPEKLARVAEIIPKHPEAGIYYSDFTVVDENLRVANRVRCRDISKGAYRALLSSNPIATSTAVVRRECFNTCGMFWEEVRGPEDWDLWIRISRRFAIVHIPVLLAQYTQHTSAPSLSDSPDFFNHQRKVVERAFSADPEITGMQRRHILSRLHYGAAREEMKRWRNAEALRYLVKSLRYDPFQWEGYIFLPLVGIRSLVRAKASSRILGSPAPR